MTTIQLKRYYPHLTENITLEVSDEIAVVLSTGGRLCDSYKRRKREHDECSLGVGPGFEPDVMFPPPTPEEIILDDRCVPYIRRTYESMASNEWWIADNHTFDVITQGDNGQRHRLHLTAFFDARSGIFTGCYVTLNPSRQATLIALRKGILKYGIPENIYVDKGSEFLTFDMEIQYVIVSKHGKDITNLNKGEQEILFQRGSWFIPTRIEGHTIYMEEV